jgi:cytochrome c2
VADSPDADSLIKKETDAPAHDPIASRSTSGVILICTLLLMGSLAWALYDEAYGQRPWKGWQRDFVERETRYLKSLRGKAKQTEAEVKESAEFQTLDAEVKAAQEAAAPKTKEIDQQVKVVGDQITAVTDHFQDARGYISVLNYRIEQASGDSDKNKLRQEVQKQRQKPIEFDMPADDGSGKLNHQKLSYPQVEKLYNDLKDKKSVLLAERADAQKEAGELLRKRNDYLKNNVTGLSDEQVRKLIERNEKFDFSLRQVNVTETNVVERCETCHLGTREPLELTPASMASAPNKTPDTLARAFVSHPNKELLQIHNPDRFGCSSCHGGNGRATTSVEKAHGQNPFWLHPLHERENIQAGCQQCHSNDRVLDGANVLNLGKDLFQQRGCVGCHRYEGFDREADGLSNTRQTISQLQDEITANEKQAKEDADALANATDDTAAQKLLSHSESLRVTNSQLAARIDELKIQSRFLMQDQKKVGPNLKDVRLKLRKEWIPVWLKDPQAFRPGTKMPTFWRFSVDEQGDDEIKAISAYLWQESFDGKLPEQSQGNAAHGKELFESRGCLACHSIGENESQIGGTFAANLTRVGQKASYDYIVRWIHNPRERWAPYCPKEKRDLTADDYKQHNLPFIFDTEGHSTCPNDGAELQVQNMTVMPNFRMPETDTRDIATYLFSLSEQASYPDASFMDDPNLKDNGRALIKQYGCAGCHEIKGFEDEQRIGKELTTEGSTPIERLDFALMTQQAEEGKDPLNLHPEQKDEEWYNHRGFFEHKLADPSIYDKGKEKEAKDRLRMPRPFLTEDWRNALTTFLLGSVGTEGASVPTSLFYNPQDQRRQDVQNGWWVIKKYNCMGCHNVQVGQRSVLMDLPLYQSADQKDQLPPRLTSEGARVDPEWLLRFLKDPSLSGAHGEAEAARSDKMVGNTATPSNESPYANATGSGGQNGSSGQNGSGAGGNSNQGGGGNGKLKPQPGADRNGVRVYLKARMPTFNFSPNELRTLMRFFMAVSSQQQPYIKETLEPLTEQERLLARQMFTSGTPCLKCHITGDPTHDKTAIAPNFLLAGERLKPEWTTRWLLDPQQISPGTAMPSGLFRKEGDRWVVNLQQMPAGADTYHGDHASLLVRYMFLLTPDEQRRLLATSPAATGGSAPAPKEPTPANSTGEQKTGRNNSRPTQHEQRANELSLLNVGDKYQAGVLNDRVAIAHNRSGYFPQ